MEGSPGLAAEGSGPQVDRGARILRAEIRKARLRRVPALKEAGEPVGRALGLRRITSAIGRFPAPGWRSLRIKCRLSMN